MITWPFTFPSFVPVQSRLSFQVLPTSATEETSGEKTETLDESIKEEGVEEQIKNISFLSNAPSGNPEETIRVSVPQADYMLGIAGKILNFRFTTKFGPYIRTLNHKIN